MRISISNIAWEPAMDEGVASILRRHGINTIDLAPAKYFPDVPSATTSEIENVRAQWADRGFEIFGMQSLLYGTTGLNLFGPVEVRKAMLNYLADVCRVASGLGVKRLVFGSPRNRDRTGLDPEAVRESSIEFFRSLGDRASDCGVTITLEPNPTVYGANFMTTSWETADVVRDVEHPSVRMQLDTGACSVNGEDVSEVVLACADILGHIHISEPHLMPVGDGDTDHVRVASAIRTHLDGHVACIEMLRSDPEPPVTSIERAVSFVSETYGPGVR